MHVKDLKVNILMHNPFLAYILSCIGFLATVNGLAVQIMKTTTDLAASCSPLVLS